MFPLTAMGDLLPRWQSLCIYVTVHMYHFKMTSSSSWKCQPCDVHFIMFIHGESIVEVNSYLSGAWHAEVKLHSNYYSIFYSVSESDPCWRWWMAQEVRLVPLTSLSALLSHQYWRQHRAPAEAIYYNHVSHVSSLLYIWPNIFIKMIFYDDYAFLPSMC